MEMKTSVDRNGFELVKDGLWLTEAGDRIAKVNPRGGLVLYAVTLVGMRRPVYLDTLKEAKRYRE
jgi:hypothetical protein